VTDDVLSQDHGIREAVLVGSDQLDAATDETLLLGSPAQFAGFYRRHEDAVLCYFLRRIRRPDVDADLSAERGEPRGWLFGIARHGTGTQCETSDAPSHEDGGSPPLPRRVVRRSLFG
jgi:hypothetical protein